MSTKFRKSPPVCLGISIIRLLTGKLKYSKQYIGDSINIEKNDKFTIFRHITISPLQKSISTVVFIVSFKFARLTHKSNKIASKIPMLLITGFPGFTTKMYAVNKKNGYWQGMYQWKSRKSLEEYKESFVFKMMNKRAITKTIASIEYENHQLLNYINKLKDQ